MRVRPDMHDAPRERTVLFRRNMTALNHHAHLLFQKIISPMSQTSRTSGWRRQNSHVIRDLCTPSEESFAKLGRRHSRVLHEHSYDDGQDQAVEVSPRLKSLHPKSATYPGTNPNMLYDQGKLMMAYRKESKVSTRSRRWRDLVALGARCLSDRRRKATFERSAEGGPFIMRTPGSWMDRGSPGEG